MADIQGKIIMRLRNWRLRILELYSGATMKISFAIKKIQYGSNLRCWGKINVMRYPGSVIKMGNRCSFRSDNSSNMIGVNRRCMLSTHSEKAVITIGNNCGFSGTVIGAREKIEMGNDVLCGANTLITDFDWHGILPHERRSSPGDSRPIIIGNNVFIGYGTVVLKGVTIGDNSVIGANSVVTKNIPANVIAGGNPCKVIKEL
jgi:acetyltransferase-like isoleucine patch superfamily enzyme